MGERSDALAAAAAQITRALDVPSPMRATAGRIVVEPNAPSTVPARATVWFDCRGESPADLDRWLAEKWDGVEAETAVESRSDGVEFAAEVRAALGRAAGVRPREMVCFAGHDAGILATKIPAGMVLVRNERGISHAPEEDVAVSDAASGAQVILRALEELT
jgi:N-carbamoyl-L-amino-acid hydrolase